MRTTLLLSLLLLIAPSQVAAINLQPLPWQLPSGVCNYGVLLINSIVFDSSFLASKQNRDVTVYSLSSVNIYYDVDKASVYNIIGRCGVNNFLQYALDAPYWLSPSAAQEFQLSDNTGLDMGAGPFAVGSATYFDPSGYIYAYYMFDIYNVYVVRPRAWAYNSLMCSDYIYVYVYYNYLSGGYYYYVSRPAMNMPVCYPSQVAVKGLAIKDRGAGYRGKRLKSAQSGIGGYEKKY